MGLTGRIRALFRLFLLFTVLVATALISAITTIRLTIRGRQELMPRLVGTRVEAAQQTATSLGLDLKVEDKIFSTQYAANQVVSQMPPPGTPIKVGQHVHVLVSLGPPQVKVPNLTGGSLRAARIAALQRGLSVGDVAAVHWKGGGPDQVVLQDPPPSSAEVRTPAVNLLTSLGEVPTLYLCPSFVGQPLSQARRTIEHAGFRVGTITPIPTGAARKDTILTQSPPAGSKIGLDTVFSFQVAE